jgi:hypothetical protein
MTDVQFRHYLLPKAEGSMHASTQCGQRERENMDITQNWDFVDCHRCWYYRSLEIVSAEELAERCSSARRAWEGLPLRGITTFCTPRSVSSRSTLASP